MSERWTINFSVSGQSIQKISGIHRFASNLVGCVDAVFNLKNEWTSLDQVSAIWRTRSNRKGIATVLDADGRCEVPQELLRRQDILYVNLVGSVSSGDRLTVRMTTYNAEALVIDSDAMVSGLNTMPVTASQFEQFTSIVADDANRAEASKIEAENSKAQAGAYAGNSAGSASAAASSATNAQSSASSASQSATDAANSAYAARLSTQEAAASAQAAGNSASSSAQASQSAQDAAQDAGVSAASAETAKGDAESARDEIRNMSAVATTLPEGSSATANYSNGLLTLGIPTGATGAGGAKGDKGEKGDTGAKGAKGDTGATPNLTIGTVETLEPTESATATITGTAEQPVLNLGIPQGEQGEVSLNQLYSILPTDEASGAIAPFPDGADNVPMLSLKVTLEPIQSGSGTPSPDNIRPISGHTGVVTHRTGKNLIPFPFNDGNRTASGVTWTMNNDGTLNAHGTASSAMYYSMYGANTTSLSALVPLESIGLKSGDTVTLSSNYSDFVVVQCNKEDGTLVSTGLLLNGGGTVTKTLPTTAKYVYIGLRVLNGASINQDNIFVQLEKGSTATSYESYQGNTYTTDLGRTVYGGTLDVVTGELVVDRAMVTLDGTQAMSIFLRANDTQVGITMYQTIGIPLARFVSDRFYQNDDIVGGSVGNIWSSRTASRMFLGLPSTVTTLTDAQAWFANNPTQVVYPLADPQTYQLTPQEVKTLLSHNNVWSDGDVEVTYKADVKLYIEKKLSQA